MQLATLSPRHLAGMALRAWSCAARQKATCCSETSASDRIRVRVGSGPGGRQAHGSHVNLP
jgi:hypothetical protein